MPGMPVGTRAPAHSGGAGPVTSAVSVLVHAKWVVQNLTDYGVPGSWMPWLGAAKAAGAVGLLVGLFVPVIGVLADRSGAVCISSGR